MKRESGCGEEENGRCVEGKWVWERRMGGVWRELGVGENGRCAEENWVWCGGEWEVWRGKVSVVGVERESGCGWEVGVEREVGVVGESGRYV